MEMDPEKPATVPRKGIGISVYRCHGELYCNCSPTPMRRLYTQEKANVERRDPWGFHVASNIPRESGTAVNA